MELDAQTRKSLIVGGAITLAGLLLIYVGVYVVGGLGSTGGDVAAGLLTLTGMTAILLAVLLFLLPPVLPAK